MRTSKTILLALAVPALLVLVGVGTSASAALPPVGMPNCTIVFCPGNTICVDTPTGPRCIPRPIKP